MRAGGDGGSEDVNQKEKKKRGVCVCGREEKILVR